MFIPHVDFGYPYRTTSTSMAPMMLENVIDAGWFVIILKLSINTIVMRTIQCAAYATAIARQ